MFSSNKIRTDSEDLKLNGEAFEASKEDFLACLKIIFGEKKLMLSHQKNCWMKMKEMLK